MCCTVNDQQQPLRLGKGLSSARLREHDAQVMHRVESAQQDEQSNLGHWKNAHKKRRVPTELLIGGDSTV